MSHLPLSDQMILCIFRFGWVGKFAQVMRTWFNKYKPWHIATAMASATLCFLLIENSPQFMMQRLWNQGNPSHNRSDLQTDSINRYHLWTHILRFALPTRVPSSNMGFLQSPTFSRNILLRSLEYFVPSILIAAIYYCYRCSKSSVLHVLF